MRCSTLFLGLAAAATSVAAEELPWGHKPAGGLAVRAPTSTWHRGLSTSPDNSKRAVKLSVREPKKKTLGFTASGPKLLKRSDADCAEQYGAGNVECGSNGCYNPGAGEDCCSNGSESCLLFA